MRHTIPLLGILLGIPALACGDEAANPEPLPALVASAPSPGATAPVGAWLVLDFASPVAPTPESFRLACGGAPIALSVSAAATRLSVNPAGPLPANSACELAWRGPTRGETLAFSTLPAGDPVPYDRDDTSVAWPFPDDFFLAEDASAATGRRLALTVPSGHAGLGQAALEAVIAAAGDADGWSPLGLIAVALPGPVDAASLPMTPRATLEPLSSLVLFDVDPASPTRGERIPFELMLRSDAKRGGSPEHTLVLWPRPLDPGRRYALVATRRVRLEDGRGLEPSAFFARALAAPAADDSAALGRVREGLAPVLSLLSEEVTPPLLPDDLALVLPITTRSTRHFADDLLAIRAELAARAAPVPEIVRVVPADPASPLAATVEGAWEVPIWTDGKDLTRDEAGRPVSPTSERIAFTLALPRASLDGPVPLVMLQHGSPGSAEGEVPQAVEVWFGERGLAAVGFTDRANRQRIARGEDDVGGVAGELLTFVQQRSAGAFFRETAAEQLAFLRMLPALSALDLLPVGAPDGVPELDLAAPLGYLGTSYGGHHGTTLLPFAPEIRAAALWVGNGRRSAILVHQSWSGVLGVLDTMPDVSVRDLWCFIAILQIAEDRDDPQSYARFLYREPLALARAAPPSLLLGEGIGDPFAPTAATRGAAWLYGPIPQLAPAPDPVAWLPSAPSPLAGNLGGVATTGMVQFVPVGQALPPTPSCTLGGANGHHCAQGPDGRRVAAEFLASSARGEVPRIVAPGELCTPSCEARACGPDGCGALCGACAAGEGCSADASACEPPTARGGDVCAEAELITSLPFQAVGTTESARDDYAPAGERCGKTLGGAPDVVFAFTPPSPMRLEARLVPTAEVAGCGPGTRCNPTLLYAVPDCADIAASCRLDDAWRNPDNALVLEVEAGRTVYFIVDGYAGNEVGSFTFSLAPFAP